MKLFDKDFLRKLELLSIVAKKIMRGELVSQRASVRKGASVEFLDHRIYSPGDDLRYLDWNVYGRLGSLFTKRFCSEENITIKIFLDCSLSMDYGSNNKFDYARRLAAALGFIGVAHFDKVEIIPFSGGRRHTPFILFSKKQFPPMLEFLEGLSSTGVTSFRREFDLPPTPERGKRVGFVISDFLDTEGYKFTVTRLQALKVQLCGVHLLDERELNPPDTGNLHLVDAEGKQVLSMAVSHSTLVRYRTALQAFCREIEKYFLHKEAGYFRIKTLTPLQEVVLLTFRHAGLLSGSRL
ncbi:DUF58 domain-containing protein [Planctomycetota bacterium]